MTIRIENVMIESTSDIKAFDTLYNLKFLSQEKEVLYTVQNPFRSFQWVAY